MFIKRSIGLGCILLLLTGFLSACGVSGEIQGKVNDGINGNYSSGNFGFVNSSDYTFNSSYINFSAGNVSLKTVTTAFNDSSSFATGTHVGTRFSSGALSLDTSSDTSLASSWTPNYSSIIGYWKFDNNTTNSISGGIDGTSSGTVAYSTSARVGTYASTYTAAGRIQFTGFGTSLGSPTTFAISFWMKPASTAQWSDVVSFGAGRFRFESINTSPSDMTIFSPGVSAAAITCSACLTNNAWTHVAFSADSSNWYLYINGVQKNTGAVAAGINVSANLYVGDRDGSVNAFTGNVDDLAVWKSAYLTAAEVKLIYHRQKQKYAGSYNSPVIDMGATGATWTSLTAVTKLPFLKGISTTAESSSQYASLSANLASSLVAYWPFEETALNSGTAGADFDDKSTGGKHGTESGGVTPAMEGVMGTSASFDGTDDSVSVGTLANFSGGFTVGGWIMVNGSNTANTTQTPISQRSSATNYDFQLNINSGLTQFNCNFVNNSTSFTATYTPSGGIQRGAWYHHICVFDSTAQTLTSYVNGVAGTAVATGGTVPPTGGVAYLGSNNGSSAYLNGRLDEFSAWTRAFSSSEILELYRRGGNRIKYQVRSCVDSSCNCKSYSSAPVGSSSDCDGDGVANASDYSDAYSALWIGPDGTASTADKKNKGAFEAKVA